MSTSTNPAPFPTVGQSLQVLTGAGQQSVIVTKLFPREFQIIGRFVAPTIKGADPRGSFIVAELQGDRWIFRHSLTPEQAGERALTAEERAEIEKTKPAQPAAPAQLP